MTNYPFFSLPSDDTNQSFNNCTLVSPEDFVQKSSKVDTFSFFHMNIRSCRQNFSQLQLFLSTVLFKFTVIILTETWLSESSDFLCELDGYNSFATHRNNHGGGIKIFVRDSISINIINEMSFINDLYESLTCEKKVYN